MMSMNRKYNEDPAFRRLVDYMVSAIIENQYTPSEMREAAMCASIKYEMAFVRPTMVLNKPIDQETENALAALEKRRVAIL